MNFFELHVGDYEAATAHLSLLEDGAYNRMLRIYYRTERPLPADLKQLCRLVRAVSKPEREAVQSVLGDFYELREDGWHQKRCDEELRSFRAREPEREAKKANEDTRLKRHREERAALFKALNDSGLHAPWNIKIEALRAMAAAATATAPETQPATQPQPLPATAPATPATATHGNVPPLPTSHLPPPNIEEEKGARKRAASAPAPDRPPDVAAQVWADWLQLRRAKRAPVTQTVLDGAVAEAAKAGMSLDAFLGIWCRRGSQGLEAAWIRPAERMNGHGDEPGWRREQRERNEEALGPFAARKRVKAAVIDIGDGGEDDGTAKLLG